MSAHQLAGSPSLRTYFQSLNALAIQQKLGRDMFRKGMGYYENDAVETLDVVDGNNVEAEVYGSEEYRVKIFARSGSVQAKCSCPYDTEWGGICKHIAAVLIKTAEEEFWREIPETVTVIEIAEKSPSYNNDIFEAWLGSLSAEELRQAVRKLAAPAFREEIRLRFGSQGDREQVFLDTKKKIQKLLDKLGRYDGGQHFDDDIKPLMEKLRGVWTDRPEEVKTMFLQIIGAVNGAQEDGSMFDEYSEESYDGSELMGFLAEFLSALPDAQRLAFLPDLWEALDEDGYDSFSGFFEMAADYLKPSDWHHLKNYLAKSELLSKADFAFQTLETFGPAMTTDEKGEWLKTLAARSDKFVVPLALFYEKEKGDVKKASKTLDKAIEKLVGQQHRFFGAGDIAKQIVEERIRLAQGQREPLDGLALRYVELLPRAESLRRALELSPGQRPALEGLLRSKDISQYLVHLEMEKRLAEVADIIERKRKDFSEGSLQGFPFGFFRYDFYARNKKALPEKALACFREGLEEELKHTGDRHYAAVVDALRNMKTLVPEVEFRHRLAEIRLLYKRRSNLMGQLEKAFGRG
ncbi:MAG: SWIM zinc finger family protein [Bacteroidetes bacterium]|nr:SWIM zinc finger family protein [Bacteroidota bacterium]